LTTMKDTVLNNFKSNVQDAAAELQPDDVEHA
jgi:hypothetical protein